MSFLSQCLFYLINYAINILSGDTLAVDFSDGFLLALAGLAVVMMGIGFFAIFKARGKAVKYLDIPLIFLCSAVSIIFKLYVAENNVFSIVPSFLMLVPSVIFDIRCIMWIVDVARKERKPEKKNAVVLVVYIVVLLLFGMVMIGSHSLHARDEEYRQREAALQAQIDEQLAIQAGLKEYDEYTHTRKYIEEIARTKLGLVYPDEIIFKAKE